ncbi:MAG TPA: GTP-binding protein [Pirellulales bacterium]|nr:GTP-binding protein [Pirellulales bacterium]
MTDLPADLAARFARRERRALAEIISLVEAGRAPAPSAANLSSMIPQPSALPRIVAFTGSGGAGKSTLVAASIAHLRSQDRTVAVLACDPNSPLTGGALLGDRVRVRFDPADEGVFFRSMSTRGAQGGISAAVGPAIEWLKAFGFDVILVETVGVGQDQLGVRPLVDVLVLLVTPNSGDEVQWEKAGLVEVADLIVVNKADLPGADRVRQQLLSALSLGPTRPAPILPTIAATGQGVVELWQAIDGLKRA